MRHFKTILAMLAWPICIQAQADEQAVLAAIKEANWPVVQQETEQLASAGLPHSEWVIDFA